VWVGCRECRAPEIRVKAMEGAEDLELQALTTGGEGRAATSSMRVSVLEVPGECRFG
jgi:hypothetical protein